MHYCANNHPVARSVSEEASLKMGNKSVFKTQCVIIQHIRWKKSRVYDFSHGTSGQKLYHIRQTTEQRHCCGGEINLQCTVFQVIFTTHLPTDIIKCLQEMLDQSVPMEQTHDTRFQAHQN